MGSVRRHLLQLTWSNEYGNLFRMVVTWKSGIASKVQSMSHNCLMNVWCRASGDMMLHTVGISMASRMHSEGPNSELYDVAFPVRLLFIVSEWVQSEVSPLPDRSVESGQGLNGGVKHAKDHFTSKSTCLPEIAQFFIIRLSLQIMPFPNMSDMSVLRGTFFRILSPGFAPFHTSWYMKRNFHPPGFQKALSTACTALI